MDLENLPQNGKKRIIVIGGGFGGLNFARSFPADIAEIILIDKRNHHLFQPLLYQVATSGLSAPDIAQPIRSILAKRKDITVLMKEVTTIDLAQKKITADKRTIPYHYLVIAAGAKTGYFGNDDWEHHAAGLKTLEDARRIRNDVLSAFEYAESADLDEAETRKHMTMVVVGGGPTGVEMAGALAELTKRVFKRDFRKIDPRNAHVILVEGLDRILNMYSPKLSAKAQKQLETLGVEVRLNTMVKDISHHQVDFKDGTSIKAANIIWAAGVEANPLSKQIEADKDRAGRIKVAPDCSIPGHPEAFAIGDLMSLTDANDKAVPGVAQGAIQSGQHVAKIIAAEIKGETSNRPAFTYFNKGDMATIGRQKAVANIFGLQFSGIIAWFTWLIVHIIFLVGLRNRLSVFLNWCYAYTRFKPGARIIWGQEQERIEQKVEEKDIEI